MKDLLIVKDLNICFRTGGGDVRAVNDFSLSLPEGSITCIVGESGSGKSVAALSLMRLLPVNAVIQGELLFDSLRLDQIDDKHYRTIRGDRIATIFEQPMSCLNPAMKVGDQLAEISIHKKGMSHHEAMARVREKLSEVRLPERCLSAYPYELSGGMRQRVMIAMALALDPELLIADEPTTSLDVTVQYQILELLRSVIEAHHMTVLMITHDLSIVYRMADQIAIMYAGYLMEIASREEFFTDCRHPYSQEFLKVVTDEDLYYIPGSVPDLLHLPKGCPFAPRCRKKQTLCEEELPPMKGEGSRKVRCHFADVD